MKDNRAHKEVMDVIHQIETDFDVNSLKFQDLNIWPWIRLYIWIQLNNPGLSSSSTSTADEKRTDWIIHVDREDLESLTSKRNIDIIFHSRPEDHTDIVEGKRYNRHVDPMIALARNSYDVLKYELKPQTTRDDLPRYEQTCFQKLSTQKQLREDKNIDVIFGFEEFQEVVSSITDKLKLYPAPFIEEINLMKGFEEYFNLVLSRIRPKAVYLVCYYAMIPMAIIRACKKLDIVTVDIQHGKQGKYHGMYTHWTKIPDIGYDLLPDFFWCWGKESKENISKWQSKEGIHHLPVIGGNRWLGMWMDEQAPFGETAEEKVFYYRLKRKRKVILITLQRFEDTLPIPEHTLEAMRRSNDDWIWLLRLHPLERDSIGRITRLMDEQGISNYEIEKSTRLPLYGLLRHSDHHMTYYSSVCYEALQFNVPTTIIDPSGRVLYEDYIKKGLFDYAVTADALMSSIEKSRSKDTLIEEEPYIVCDKQAAESALETTVNGSGKQMGYVGMENANPIENAVALNHQGEALFKAGKIEDALSLFEKIVQMKPDYPAAHNNLGVTCFAKGDVREALDHFDKAVSLDPSNADSVVNYGSTLTLLESADAAETLYQSYISQIGQNNLIQELLITLQSRKNNRLSAAVPISHNQSTRPKIIGKIPHENPFCVFLNLYYQGYLDSHYRKHQGLNTASYAEQLESIQRQYFGDSDFYSEGLKSAGWCARDIIVNCHPLQQAWATENGFKGNGLDIVIEQIRHLNPQVVYIQGMEIGTAAFLTAIRPYTQLIVGQIASPLPEQTHVSGFDLIFSSFPHFVDRFRAKSVTAYYQPLAFDPRVIEQIGNQERIYPVTFVGGLSAHHGQGNDIISRLAESIPIDIWGYGAQFLPEDSPLKNVHHGEAWAQEMFTLLCQSKITINRHIDVSENYANNMRLFEATGCGALLITDYKDNLMDLFDIGKEIVVYRSAEECTALVSYYTANPEEAEKIARAGQQRTLSEHSYGARMAQTAEILERHLRYKQEGDRFPPCDMSKISYGYAQIQPNEISQDMRQSWKDEKIPSRQRGLVQRELESMYHGKTPPVYQVLADCIRPYAYPGCSILEIGCASGYYYEVLEYLLNMRISYTGVDFSEPFVTMAKDYSPKASFCVADGANLPFRDRRYFIAVSSCILLHVPDFSRHIAETVRVADKYVVAHRTPVHRNGPTRYYKKYAYGVETAELHFNEQEIVREFQSRGLALKHLIEYDAIPHQDFYEITYLFEKTD